MSAPTRRCVLRGAATTLWLPFLPSLARAEPAAPRRIVWWFLPNGLIGDAVTPAQTGPDYVLPGFMEALAPLKQRVSIVTGLENRATAAGTAGTHERALSSLLTDHVVGDVYEGPLDNATSADQYAAQRLTGVTPFPSLQLGTNEAYVKGRGNLDVYFTHLSWADGGTPLTPLADPKMLFDRMFAGQDPTATAEELARRDALRKSVLDAVLDRVGALEAGLDAADKLKLDQYTTSVRELETRIDAIRALACEVPPEPVPNLPLADRVAAMADLIGVALQCDYTRIVTFMLAPTAALTAYTDLGITKAHHSISHDYLYQDIDRTRLLQIHALHVTWWSRFLTRLDATGLLDHTLVAFTTEFSEPNQHLARPLPVVLAGGEGGGVLQGLHRAVPAQPHSNLWRAMIDFAGVDPSGWGEQATGTLALGG